VLQAEMCSVPGPGLTARKSILHAPRVFYEDHQHSGSCVIPGMLQEARQRHDAGLAARLLWSYTERVFPFDCYLVLHTENQGMDPPMPPQTKWIARPVEAIAEKRDPRGQGMYLISLDLLS